MMGYKTHIILHQNILYPDYANPNNLTFMSNDQKRLARQQRLNQLRANKERESEREREREREREKERKKARE